MKTMKIKSELTRISSKGQIVIPQNIRTEMRIKEGNVFAVLTPKKDTLILKKIESKISKEDLETLRGLEKAWKQIEEGKYRKYTREEFLKKLEKW
jgi:AbrB family looped-hinge helix DNA binding protein